MATSPVSIHANTDALKLLSKKLALSAPVARKVAMATIRAEATKVKNDAAQRASYSKTVAGTGKVSIIGGLNVKVTFGGGDGWKAPIFENKGAGFVEHPVFGNLHGQQSTNKNSHPAFLLPAFVAHTEEIIEVLTVAVTKAISDGLEL